MANVIQRKTRAKRLDRIAEATETLENAILELNKSRRLGVPSISQSAAFRSLYYLQRLAKKAK